MSTALGDYATLASAKLRLNITASTDDALLQSLCDAANMWIESKTDRVLAPLASAAYLVDGWDAIESRCLLFPRGIVSLTLVENTTYTGGTFATVPSSDWFLRPVGANLQPGWPFTELWMTNIPSSGNTTPAFYPGFATVRVTGILGWPAIPDDVANLGNNIVVGLWRGRSSGGADAFSLGLDGERTISRLLSSADWATVKKYTRAELMVV